MSTKDKLFKEKILPMYHQLQNEIKIVFEEHGILSDFIDENNNFISPVKINRSNSTDCPLTSLSPKFQAHYREIAPKIIHLVSSFQEYVFSLWPLQEK